MNCLLRSTINQIQNKIIKLNCDINRGGCITFAKYLSKELEKRDIKFQVVFIDEKYYLTSLKKAIIEKQYNDLFSIFHVALKIEDLIIDGEKSIKTISDGYDYIKMKIDSNFLNIYEQNAEWNFTFCRDLFSNKINKIIKAAFKEYEKIKNMS